MGSNFFQHRANVSPLKQFDNVQVVHVVNAQPQQPAPTSGHTCTGSCGCSCGGAPARKNSRCDDDAKCDCYDCKQRRFVKTVILTAISIAGMLFLTAAYQVATWFDSGSQAQQVSREERVAGPGDRRFDEALGGYHRADLSNPPSTANDSYLCGLLGRGSRRPVYCQN